MGLSKRRFTEMQDYVAEKKKENIGDIEETYRKLRLKEKKKRQNKSPSR